MKNNRVQVYELARELHVSIADIQWALHLLDLPERQHATGWISGQHADVIRRGLQNGVWRPRTRRKDEPPLRPTLPPSGPTIFRCPCCQQRAQVDRDSPALFCDDCSSHQDDEQQRTQDHLDQAGRREVELRRKLDSMQKERDSAFVSRNSWRRTLVELILNHAPDEDNGHLCLCGESYPCTSRRLLPSLNRGVANEVIRFEGMPPDQRETELDGRQWTMMDELGSIFYGERSA